MKVAMFKRAVQHRQQIFPPFAPHLFFDSVIDGLVKDMDGRDVVVQSPGDIPWWDGKRPVKSMLVFCGGGAGDRIQQTCAFRKLSQRIGMEVDVCAHPCEEWENLPYIGVRHPWMPPWEIIECYDACCTFETILGCENERTTHLAELFAERLFVGPLWPGTQEHDAGEFRCDWVWGPGEVERSFAVPPKPDGVSWVALQWASNGSSRNYPPESLTLLATLLASRPNTVVMIVGDRDQGPAWATPVYGMSHMLPDPIDGVVNLCGKFGNLRRLAAFLTHCDLFIGPDSGPLHLAGALDIPSIGLYGPHTYLTRGKYFLKQRAIEMTDPQDARCPCHTHADQHFGTLPCGSPYCRLMASIPPDHIYRKASEYLDELEQRRGLAHADGNAG